MKKIEGPVNKKFSTNCGGRDETFEVTLYEIEDGDVGRTKEHYLGHHHASHKFTKDDVGRVIEVRSQGDHYTCWFFNK